MAVHFPQQRKNGSFLLGLVVMKAFYIGEQVYLTAHLAPRLMRYNKNS